MMLEARRQQKGAPRGMDAKIPVEAEPGVCPQEAQAL